MIYTIHSYGSMVMIPSQMHQIVGGKPEVPACHTSCSQTPLESKTTLSDDFPLACYVLTEHSYSVRS